MFLDLQNQLRRRIALSCKQIFAQRRHFLAVAQQRIAHLVEGRFLDDEILHHGMLRTVYHHDRIVGRKVDVELAAVDTEIHGVVDRLDRVFERPRRIPVSAVRDHDVLGRAGRRFVLLGFGIAACQQQHQQAHHNYFHDL